MRRESRREDIEQFIDGGLLHLISPLIRWKLFPHWASLFIKKKTLFMVPPALKNPTTQFTRTYAEISIEPPLLHDDGLV